MAILVDSKTRVLVQGITGQKGRPATALGFAGEGARLALAGRSASALAEVAREVEVLGAKAILFLASDLTECVAGQQPSVDGGQTGGVGC